MWAYVQVYASLVYFLKHTSQLQFDRNKLLLINKENWIFINSHKNESSNVHIVKNEDSVSCQLQDTYLYDTYIVVVVDVVAAELVIWESVLTYLIKKGFTYKSYE